MSTLYHRIQVKEKERKTGAASEVNAGRPAKTLPGDDTHLKIKTRIQQRLISEVDSKYLANSRILSEEQKEDIRNRITTLLQEEDLDPLERQDVADSLVAEIVGYGPIEPLLEDPEVSEVMINGPYRVYVERRGKIEATDIRFYDEKHLLHLIDKIVAPLGRRIDESSPMVDARLPDGSRVNAIIPPLALKGPAVTIRKFARDPLQVRSLIALGTLTRPMALFLEACVRARLNIIVSGGTGSGKTTTLNVLSSFIPPDERIVTIEDAAELQLRQEHVVSLETRPPNIEGKGEITMRMLVRNALRMRPDRIVVGEVRGGEALDMLQAMNTGHDGSLTTAHANGPRDLLARLETMVLMAGVELPLRAIREQVSSGIDLIVHQSRLKDGSRKVTHITEVQGMEGEVIILQDLFVFRQTGVTTQGKVLGEFRATGIRPRFMERLEAAGVDLPDNIFD